MTEEYRKVTPRSPIGKALEYSLKRWKELTLFTTDGQLEIDNRKENEIRPIALGRKNYLFPCSHESAQRIAKIYSLLASCRAANGIDPMKWLTHVLEELPNRTVNDIEGLLPHKRL